MDADVGIKFFFLLGMTGKAWSGNIIGKFKVKWCMRIGMTAETSIKFKMRGPFMTLAAGRNNFLNIGWMAVMAIHTGHFGFMLATRNLYIFRGIGMAFDTVSVFQRCHTRR